MLGMESLVIFFQYVWMCSIDGIVYECEIMGGYFGLVMWFFVES